MSIATGVVRHARLRPVRHAFEYRVPFLRLRVDGLEARPWPWPLSRGRFNLLSVRDRDYLFGDGSFETKARALLQRQGIADADGAIWLHTFPRVLGYAFNPVSFWFCERADGALRAIVAEVNNTFGERHCYLLAHPDGRAIRNGESLTAAKVFHVSPFCQVEGEYRFRFLHRRDSAGRVEATLARIDYRDRDGDLLLTSISGRPVEGTAARLLVAVAARPWFTVGVVVRIHLQALRLWARRVPFFRKPVPPEQAVTS